MLGFEKGDGELPPSYDSTTTTTLTDSSHGAELSITPSGTGWFVPGDDVRANLRIPNDVLSSIEGEIKCSLEGKSTVEVMGKQRYQKAQMVQASLGSNPMPITGQDEHVFALESLSLPRPDSFGGDTDTTVDLMIPERRTCDCPISKSGDGVPPSLGWKGSLGERNRVRWKLRVIIPRKGMLKRDVKLSIELPVSLPPPTPSKSPLTASDGKVLIYKTSGTELEAPKLETTLTVAPGSSNRIPFRIDLRSPLLDDSIQVSVGLCKHTWTKGINTSLGSDKGHDFPGIMVGSLKLHKPDPQRGTIEVTDKGAAGWALEGEYVVDEGMMTVLGCAIRLSWSLQVQIRWKKLDSPMVVAQLIHLPHYSAV